MQCPKCPSQRAIRNGGGRTNCPDCRQTGTLGPGATSAKVEKQSRPQASSRLAIAPRRHFIIPDTQVKKGVPTDHLAWIGEAVREYEPDEVIHLGDHWDFPALSRHDEFGSLAMEGSRVEDDIQAGNDGLALLDKHMGKPPKKKKRRKSIHDGNHEHRLIRAINSDPRLAGTLGYHLLNRERLGWGVVPYENGAPGQQWIDDIVYAHFFSAVNTGRAIGGTANNKLNHIGDSFVQGHVQGYEPGFKQFATGKTKKGIVAGSAYLHDENYKGQANGHWRGVVVLNEVRGGTFCEMPLTLDYLCRKYEGISLGSFLRKKYKDAEQRFTLARLP